MLKRRRLEVEYTFKKFFLTYVFMTIPSILLVLFFLSIQRRNDLMGYLNAFQIVGIINLLFGWLMFINNENLFTSVGFLFKKFFGIIRDRSMGYYEYIEQREKVPTHIVINFFINMFIFGGIGIILHVIYNANL